MSRGPRSLIRSLAVRRQTASHAARDAIDSVAAFARWPVFSIASHRMVTDLARQGIRPSYVVDVGANRGQFSVAALHVWPQADVVAFEPIPEAAAALRELAGRWPTRLEVVEAAVGGTTGVITLHVNNHSQASSVLDLTRSHLEVFPAATPERQVSVPLTTLDESLASRAAPAEGLLKIDVQGFEREVLAGASAALCRFRHLVIEASFRPLYDGEWTFLELVHHLEERGFRFLRPVGMLKDPATGEHLQIDALFEAAR